MARAGILTTYFLGMVLLAACASAQETVQQLFPSSAADANMMLSFRRALRQLPSASASTSTTPGASTATASGTGGGFGGGFGRGFGRGGGFNFKGFDLFNWPCYIHPYFGPTLQNCGNPFPQWNVPALQAWLGRVAQGQGLGQWPGVF
jgi:hypothetical protein